MLTLVLPILLWYCQGPVYSWTLRKTPSSRIKEDQGLLASPLCANVCPYFFAKKLS